MSTLISRFKEDYLRTKKSLGQHFLTNRRFVEEITEAAIIDKCPVVEIGPGCGVLTEELAKRVKDVTVIDIDDNAVEFLENNRAEFFPNINIVHADVLKIELDKLYDRKISVVGNLPYNLSVKILEHCTNYIDSVENLVFMFQKEVASRINAEPNSKEYSSLSVYCRYHYDMKKIRDISGSNFWPNANVMSTVLNFQPKQQRLLAKSQEEDFFTFLRKAFTQKRKTLHNNLKDYIEKELLDGALEKLNLSKTIRAEQVTLENFVKIYEYIKL